MVVTLDRLQGYRRALEEAACPYGERFIDYGEFRQEGGYEAANKFLAMKSDRPTAIFAANDLMAIGAMQAIQEAGLNVPRDCSVIGCNDSPIAAVTSPRLTSSRAPYCELAREAAQALIAQLSSEPAQPVKKLIPCQLIVRDSTSLPAASTDSRVN
jgi:DNA-binding LacI/PurR family transcriptional regulator